MLNCYDFTMALALKRLVDARRTRLQRNGSIQGVQPLHRERKAQRVSSGR